ncbi:MAG: molybdopterin cofactor-binding domain-containing protein [Actinomycetota bacterium]
MVDVIDRIARGVGESVRRIDGIPKTQGAFRYGSDLEDDRMLWGATLRSPHPHARVVSIGLGEALASPGVHAVLTADDVPGKKTYGVEFADQPVLAMDRVRYVGEPVAIVAAETPELARRAAAKVDVTYEELAPVLDPELAMAEDAARLHDFGNVVRHVTILHGDPAQAEADAGAAGDLVVVEGYYETGMQDQAPLGPEAGLAVPAEDGGIDLYVSTQWLHVDRQQMAPCLALAEERVRIHLAGVGGAFGAREDLHMQIHASLLALHTNRPVKMSYGREESFFGHVHRHPSRIWMRHAARRDGRLVSVKAYVLVDGGAYTSSSSNVIGNAATFATGPYEVPNAEIHGTGVYTNNPPCGAMRGFGAVQVCFAYEAQMDRLAAELGMDPVDLRRRNLLGLGSVMPTGQVVGGSAPVREVLDGLAAIPAADPPERERDAILLPGGANNVTHGEALKRGVGVALGHKNIAYSEGFDDYADAAVTLSLALDGEPVAEVHSAAVEVGQGLTTLLTQIVREELGIDRVVILGADTTMGSAGSTSASRQTLMTGGAVQSACRAVREELAARASARSVPADAFVELLEDPVEASVRYRHEPTQPLDERGQGDAHAMFVFAAERAVVEVDEDLGLVRVVEIAASQDVGHALNPQSVQGQVEGGTAQGLGLALLEELQLRDGRIANASFTDYLIPTILDMPPVVSHLVEDPDPVAPFGAKGVGETSTLVSTPAIAAALRAATGRELNRVPIRPEDLIGMAEPVRPRHGGWPTPPSVPGPRPVAWYAGLGDGGEDRVRAEA